MAKTGAIRAGRAYVELFADKSELVRGLKAAEYHLKQFGRNVRRLGMQMMKLAGLAAVPLVAGTKVFADFEEQMANVATMLDRPEEHMDRFRAAIRKMAVEFGESTEALAAGLYDILSASVAPEHALGVLEASVRAAKAGLTDTKTAADAITTVLNAYGLSAERAADVSDLLFQIVKRGKTTFAELAPAIGVVATTAATAGVPLDEMGAALATMTRYGIRTEMAVVALNQVVSAFLNPSKEAAEYARSLGFELSSTTVHAEGLAGVFKRIASLPPEAVAKLFPNVRALRGVLPALQNMEGFLGDVTLMAERAGATERAYGKMTGTLAHGFRQIKQAGLEVLRAVGDALAEPVKKAGEAIKAGLLYVRDLIAHNKELILSIAKVALIVGAVGTALVAVGMAVQALGFAFGGLATLVALPAKTLLGLIGVLSGVASALFSVHGAVLVAGAALVYFSGLGGKATDWLKGKFDELKKDALAAFDGIKDALASGDLGLAARIVWLTLKMEWHKGIRPLAEAWEGFVFGLKAAWEIAVHAIARVWLDLTYTLQKAWARFSSWWQETQTKLSGWLARRMLEVQGIFDETLDVEFAKRQVDVSIRQELGGLEAERKARLSALEEEHALARQFAEDEHRQRLANLGEEYDERVAATEEALRKAKEDWQAALAEARRKRETQETGKELGPAPEFAPPKLEELLGGLSAALGRISVVGTFTAAAAWGLGTGNTADRIARATEETAKNTRKLTDKAAEGGLVFA